METVTYRQSQTKYRYGPFMRQGEFSQQCQSHAKMYTLSTVFRKTLSPGKNTLTHICYSQNKTDSNYLKD